MPGSQSSYAADMPSPPPIYEATHSHFTPKTEIAPLPAYDTIHTHSLSQRQTTLEHEASPNANMFSKARTTSLPSTTFATWGSNSDRKSPATPKQCTPRRIGSLIGGLILRAIPCAILILVGIGIEIDVSRYFAGDCNAPSECEMPKEVVMFGIMAMFLIALGLGIFVAAVLRPIWNVCRTSMRNQREQRDVELGECGCKHFETGPNTYVTTISNRLDMRNLSYYRDYR